MNGGFAEGNDRHGWPHYGNGDLVKIILNCNSWECEFHKNGEMGGKISIPSNVKHHPIIGCSYGKVHLEIEE